jgi:DNA-binding MarR family transcriptional regulator
MIKGGGAMLSSLEALEQINLRRQALLKKACHEAGGTIADWKIVNYLKNELLSIQDFVELSGLDMSTLSRQVKKAVEKELILRKNSNQDHRRLVFEVTEKGQLLRAYVNEQISKFDQKLFENWSKEESAMFNILINRVLKNARK